MRNPPPDLPPHAYDVARQPPTVPDAEAAVLGALLVDNAQLPRVRAVLPDASAFYDAHNRHVYEAVLALTDGGSGVDTVTVDQWLRARDKSGAGYYLADLTSRVAVPGHAEFYAQVTREAAIKRDLIRKLTTTLSRAYDPATDAFDVLDGARDGVNEVTLGLPGHALTPSTEAVDAATDDLLHEADHGVRPGVDTGFGGLDVMLGGLRPGGLYCIAGRPAMGKSMLGLSIAHRVARTGEGVAFFSLEMSTSENVERLLAAEADVDGTAIQRRRLLPEQRERIVDARARIREYPIHWDDTPAITPEEVRAKLHRLTAAEPLSVVVVDYLQLMRGKGDNRTQEVGHCSRSLKAIAKEYGVAVVALAQLSRAVESRAVKRPQLSDLRDSGEIEQDSDAVCFLYRPEYYGVTHEERGAEAMDVRGLCEVIVAKQRKGDVGSVWLRFDGSRTRFLGLTEAPAFSGDGARVPVPDTPF